MDTLIVLVRIHPKTATYGQPVDVLDEPYRKKRCKDMQARKVIPRCRRILTIPTLDLGSISGLTLISGLVLIHRGILALDLVPILDRIPTVAQDPLAPE
jgi:hypothetical protein